MDEKTISKKITKKKLIYKKKILFRKMEKQKTVKIVKQ